MRSAPTRNSQSRPEGCGFLALTCLFTCFFLILNSALTVRFYPQLSAFAPSLLQHPRVEQMMMFLGPVLLIFVEWWLVDLIVDALSPLSRLPPGRQQASKNRDAR